MSRFMASPYAMPLRGFHFEPVLRELRVIERDAQARPGRQREAARGQDRACA